MESSSASLSNSPGGDPIPRRAVWLWLALGAAIVSIIGSVVALVIPAIYASLTPAFLPQALAQDVGNLAVASPAMVILGILALRGSLRAYLLWLGVIIFTVYNYVIYTLSVPFGSLYLVWVAVLGLCLYALIGGIATVDHNLIQGAYSSRRTVTAAAWTLIVAVPLIAFVWLSEDLPALLSGTTPQSLIDLAIPTNPVHILDLSFFLPAALLIGIWLLHEKPLAYTIAPALLVFLVLTGVPILVTPVVQVVRGKPADWSVFLPIGVMTIIFSGMLVWLISTIRTKKA